MHIQKAGTPSPEIASNRGETYSTIDEKEGQEVYYSTGCNLATVESEQSRV